ncbi:unnamed protein product [Nesidiocoris tenuis]|uniref:Integrase catalytic domain-containing protein n=1 Tax=Nesidiocoris tenuis TaxID=355587 RepID=A0A6H5GMX1_9HEMI|nr:unnamed protein product [Nesidiocoris tenuis]
MAEVRRSDRHGVSEMKLNYLSQYQAKLPSYHQGPSYNTTPRLFSSGDLKTGIDDPREQRVSDAQGLVYPQLTSSNFSTWKFRVEYILEKKGVKSVAREKFVFSGKDEKAIKDFMAKDIEARNVIVMCVSDKHIEYIKDAKSAFEMFEALTNIFARKSVLSRLFIRRKLLQLKCSKNGDLQEHFLVFDTLIRDLRETGSAIEEDDIVCHLLLTLPSCYETVVTVLESTTTQLTVEFVKSKLLDMELKLKSERERDRESAADHFDREKEDYSFGSFSRLNQNRRKVCFGCGSHFHLQSDCNRGQRQLNRNVYQPPTYPRGYYRGRGSYTSPQGAWHNSNRGAGNRNGAPRVAHFTDCTTQNDSSRNEIAFVALTSESGLSSIMADGAQVEFLLDSGASCHLVNRDLLRFMTEVTDIQPVKIKIANGSAMTACKEGTLKLRCEKTKLTINLRALVVNNLLYNLISVTKINNAGYKVVFEKDRAKIMINRRALICENKSNLFVASFRVGEIQENCSSTVMKDENIWHYRLGHLNRRGLQLLNLPVGNEICDSCCKAKATRLPFEPVLRKLSHRVGELLYTDVWGPTKDVALNGDRYFVSVVDDYSRFAVVYTIRSKSEAAEKLMQHIEKMRSSDIVVSRIRSDRGGEFRSSVFNQYCRERGIHQEFTVGYTPQQCSVAERLNRTLLNKVRAMFIDTNLPKSLWPEAVTTAVYQLNRSPTRALNGDIPARIYLGDCNLDKLRVFGCKAWVLNLPRASKFEPRATEMRLVGYAGGGYRLWDPIANRITVARDVRFDEKDFDFCPRVQNSIEPDVLEEKPAVEEDRSLEPENSSVRVFSREKREVRRPVYLQDYEVYEAYCMLAGESDDPQTYSDAVKSGQHWENAIKSELDSLERHNTWTVVDVPTDRPLIDTRWVFRTKADGSKKARLVAKGYQLTPSENIYAPVAKMPTVRLMLSHAVQHDLPLRQLDIPSAFLNGTLRSEIYLKIPEGVHIENGKCLRLNKSIYGLKEAPRLWNECFDSFAAKNGLKRSPSDSCLYVGRQLWMVVWVDDILITGRQSRIDELVVALEKEFDAKDLGQLASFLGIKIVRNEDSLQLSQSDVIDKIIARFRMADCKAASTPMETKFQVLPSEPAVDVPYRELIGCLNYIAIISRPDISFATSFLGRYLETPTSSCWSAAKRIVRYLKGTRDLVLTFARSASSNRGVLNAFADANWGNDVIDRKSTSGMAIFFNGHLISWGSKKQQTVALSSAESEFIAAAYCCSELICLQRLVLDFSYNNVSTATVPMSPYVTTLNFYDTSHVHVQCSFITQRGFTDMMSCFADWQSSNASNSASGLPSDAWKCSKCAPSVCPTIPENLASGLADLSELDLDNVDNRELLIQLTKQQSVVIKFLSLLSKQSVSHEKINKLSDDNISLRNRITELEDQVAKISSMFTDGTQPATRLSMLPTLGSGTGSPPAQESPAVTSAPTSRIFTSSSNNSEAICTDNPPHGASLERPAPPYANKLRRNLKTAVSSNVAPSPRTTTPVGPHQRKNRPCLTGQNKSRGIKVAKRTKSIFVSRIDPDASSSDLACAISELNLNYLKITKLKTRRPSYSSFHVNVFESDFLQVFCTEVWPEGCLISEYYGRVTDSQLSDPIDIYTVDRSGDKA